MTPMRFAFVLVFILFLAPFSLSAQVVITEIMYDLQNGADAYREWLEISNTGDESVDLTGWKFYEEGSNHGMEVYQGDVTLSPGGYAVIVNKPEEFLSDWPGFSGTMFDSSWGSFKNTDGEALSIRNADLMDIDTIMYSPEWGASGDGNSLQKILGSWKAALPTPGMENGGAGTDTETDAGEGGSSGGDGGGEAASGNGQSDGFSSESGGSGSSEPQIKAVIEKFPPVAIPGVPAEFRGSAYDLKGELIKNARYAWNFGNGARKEGQNIFYTYPYPGDYIVIFDVSSGTHTASLRKTVSVVEVLITVNAIGTEDNFYIELLNSSPYEIDLGGWLLYVGNHFFQIPPNTFILPKRPLAFHESITVLSYPKGGEDISLTYPNGVHASVYSSNDTLSLATVVVSQSENVDIREEESNKDDDGDAIKIIPARAGRDAIEESPSIAEVSSEDGSDELYSENLAVLKESLPDEKRGLDVWFGLLLGLVGFSAIGFIFIRSKRTLADEFAIVEDKGFKSRK